MFKKCTLLPNFAKHPDSLDKTYALFNTGFNDGRFKNMTPDSGTLYIAYDNNYSRLFIAGAKITDDYEEFTIYQKGGQDYPIWNQHAAEIQSVDILSHCTAPTAINLFADLSNIVTIGDFSNLYYDKNKVHSVMGMFQKCTKLDFSTLEFDNFETMGDIYHAGSMFASCKWVGPLLGSDPSGFGPFIYLDFNQCRNFSGMFAYSNFTEIRLFDELKYLPVVDTMKSMFEGCSQLRCIHSRSNWDFSHSPITTNMFTNCKQLHNWDASNPTDNTYALIDNGFNGGYFTNYY